NHHVDQGEECDDGNLADNDGCNHDCTIPRCLIALDCDDGIPCTVDRCDPVQGCLHMPNKADCDDQKRCTQDLCEPASPSLPADSPLRDARGCTHPQRAACPCEADEDCDDRNVCNG